MSNCNFTANTVTISGGAVYFNETGSVSNCNFTDNTANIYGGAVYFKGNGSVSNCNFTDNTAKVSLMTDGGLGGALYMSAGGTILNCNFNNNQGRSAGAIYSRFYKVTTADTCIFKTPSDTTYNTRILPPTLNVDNFTAFYGSGEKVTFDLKTNSGIPVTNGNISISVYFKNNDSWVGNYSCLSGEGWAVDLPAGSYYAIFDTEYTEFQPVTRTITIKYYINVTSVTTNNKTVNITAKSNIPHEIIQGKLLFILPNGTEINANYAGNGTWWAVHTFDDYAIYQVSASYIGLDNITVSNATINISKANSTITVDNVVLDYCKSINVTVATEGAKSITAKTENIDFTVVDNFTIQIFGLAVGNHILTVTTIPDDNHNSVSKTINITVNKVDSTLTVDNVVLDYCKSINVTVATEGAKSITAKTENIDFTVVDNFTIQIFGLAVGNHTLTVTTIPDDDHNSVSKTVNITVNKVDSTLTVDNITFDYNSSGSTVVSFTGAGGVVASVINQSNAVVKVNGTNITVSTLNAGTYTLTVTTIADANHNNVTKNATITVNKLKTVLTGNAITAVYNINKNLVTLKDAKGNALTGASVTVVLNGAKTYITDSNGQIKVPTKVLAPKSYTVKVTYNGDVNYDKSAKDVKVTVKKATPKLTAKKKTFKRTTKTKKYKVILKDNAGNAINKAKIILKVKGKKYKVTTISKGKAIFKITKLKKKGTFKAVITYKGNNCYNKVSKKAKIKVK